MEASTLQTHSNPELVMDNAETRLGEVEDSYGWGTGRQEKKAGLMNRFLCVVQTVENLKC